MEQLGFSIALTDRTRKGEGSTTPTIIVVAGQESTKIRVNQAAQRLMSVGHRENIDFATNYAAVMSALADKDNESVTKDNFRDYLEFYCLKGILQIDEKTGQPLQSRCRLTHDEKAELAEELGKEVDELTVDDIPMEDSYSGFRISAVVKGSPIPKGSLMWPIMGTDGNNWSRLRSVVANATDNDHVIFELSPKPVKLPLGFKGEEVDAYKLINPRLKAKKAVSKTTTEVGDDSDVEFDDSDDDE